MRDTCGCVPAAAHRPERRLHASRFKWRPRAPQVSALVPNLEELTAALDGGSDGARLTSAFDAPDLPAARSALRAVVDDWEQSDVAGATMSSGPTAQ